MRRRAFIAMLAGAAAGLPLTAYAQHDRMRRIGVLMSFAASDPDAQENGAPVTFSAERT